MPATRRATAPPEDMERAASESSQERAREAETSPSGLGERPAGRTHDGMADEVRNAEAEGVTAADVTGMRGVMLAEMAGDAGEWSRSGLAVAIAVGATTAKVVGLAMVA
jgi:hypothetical protein